MFSKIASFLLIVILLIQCSMLTLVSYMYTDHNEFLTASCCINKGIDDSCQAKCFLANTQETDKKNKSTELKKINASFFQEVKRLVVSVPFRLESKHKHFYKTDYSFLYGCQSPRPPIA